MTKGALVGMVIGLVDQMGLWVISAQENWKIGGGGGAGRRGKHKNVGYLFIYEKS